MSDVYEFIDVEYATSAAAPAITRMCAWLEVSKSGYYEWRSRPESATAKRREELRLLIKKAFDEFAKKLPHIPIWVLHGADDPVVPVTESREMARALSVRAVYTEFAHTGHNAWDPAYTQTHLVQWLTEQKR